MKTILLPEQFTPNFKLGPKVQCISSFIQRDFSGRIIYSVFTFKYDGKLHSVSYSYDTKGNVFNEYLDDVCVVRNGVRTRLFNIHFD